MRKYENEYTRVQKRIFSKAKRSRLWANSFIKLYEAYTLKPFIFELDKYSMRPYFFFRITFPANYIRCIRCENIKWRDALKCTICCARYSQSFFVIPINNDIFLEFVFNKECLQYGFIRSGMSRLMNCICHPCVDCLRIAFHCS